MSKDNPTMQEVTEAITELRTLTEKSEQKTADAIEKSVKEKIEKFLDDQEAKSQKITADLNTKAKEAEELKERMVELEKQIAKPGSGKTEAETEKELSKKAFENFIRNGEDSLKEAEVKYLRTDSDVEGGYLVVPEYVQDIIKNVTLISPIRSLAKVRQTTSKSLLLPVRTGLLSASWEGEGEAVGDSNSTYGMINLPMNNILVNVPITVQQLGDASFNMEAEINADVAEAFAYKEGIAFTAGTGTGGKQPEGFMTNTDVSTRNSGVADDITMDSIILLAGDLKSAYQNPGYVMNRQTVAAVRVKKDGMGQYLWQQGNIAAGIPNTLNGYKYTEIPAMDDIAASAYPIAFGDFLSGYMIVDRMALNVVRDPYALKKKAMVEFTFMKRVGGQVVKAEAIKKLRCHT